jgi:hypothetical protein
MNSDFTDDSKDSGDADNAADAVPTRLSNFIIWVDGVGGFLVCCGLQNKIGQAIPDSEVTVPLRGDLDREHARIETVEDRHLLHPIGTVSVDGCRLREPAVLIHGQTIQLGETVAIGYRKPHPLSATAVLDFVSRHRTFPWSDAVIIAGDSILLGNQSRNHIVCPRWKHELILYRRQNEWFCKTKAAAFFNGNAFTSDVPLQDKSRVHGEDFSFSIEAV